MTVKAHRLHYLVCDGCGAQHADQEGDFNTLAIRVSAGIHGWRYLERPGGPRLRQRRQHLDYCPACAEKQPGDLLADLEPVAAERSAS